MLLTMFSYSRDQKIREDFNNSDFQLNRYFVKVQYQNIHQIMCQILFVLLKSSLETRTNEGWLTLFVKGFHFHLSVLQCKSWNIHKSNRPIQRLENV